MGNLFLIFYILVDEVETELRKNNILFTIGRCLTCDTLDCVSLNAVADSSRKCNGRLELMVLMIVVVLITSCQRAAEKSWR